jgi:hypothetical protein
VCAIGLSIPEVSHGLGSGSLGEGPESGVRSGYRSRKLIDKV